MISRMKSCKILNRYLIWNLAKFQAISCMRSHELLCPHEYNYDYAWGTQSRENSYKISQNKTMHETKWFIGKLSFPTTVQEISGEPEEDLDWSVFYFWSSIQRYGTLFQTVPCHLVMSPSWNHCFLKPLLHMMLILRESGHMLMSYGVAMRPVRQETTMARAGMLPDYLHQQRPVDAGEAVPLEGYNFCIEQEEGNIVATYTGESEGRWRVGVWIGQWQWRTWTPWDPWYSCHWNIGCPNLQLWGQVSPWNCV